MTDPVRLSPHFTLPELCVSSRAAALGIPNEPRAAVIENLRRLCVDLLEPVRDQFGAWRVTSGYRSPEINRLTPGSSTTSAHPMGCAADGVPAAPHTPADLVRVVKWVAASPLPFDQAIFEAVERGDGLVCWVHLGVALPGRAPRRQALQMLGRGYAAFDAKACLAATQGGAS